MYPHGAVAILLPVPVRPHYDAASGAINPAGHNTGEQPLSRTFFFPHMGIVLFDCAALQQPSLPPSHSQIKPVVVSAV